MKFHESLNEFHNSFERKKEKKKKLHTTTIRALPKFRCAFKRKITTLRSLEFVPLPSPWGDRYAKNFQSFPSLRIKPRGFARAHQRKPSNSSTRSKFKWNCPIIKSCLLFRGRWWNRVKVTKKACEKWYSAFRSFPRFFRNFSLACKPRYEG